MRPVRRRVLVAGDVQGVWFRATCRDEAVSRGVAGWAVNLPDGRVEVVLEGPPIPVGEVVSWCRQGPPRATVRAVEVSQEPPEGLGDFVIR